jgi:hypothetical protein
MYSAVLLIAFWGLEHMGQILLVQSNPTRAVEIRILLER